MKIYAFSGLGADQRIFNFLNLENELVPILWIDPEPEETLASYALRLAEQIDTSTPFVLMGVSFGGMSASELSKSLSPAKTILISSAANKHELPWMAAVDRKWNLSKKLPTGIFKPPQWAAWLGFPTNKGHRKIAQGIMRDTDPDFVKWALGAIARWENEEVPKNLLHIHGRLDPILPLKKRMNALVVGKGHFIILKKAKELRIQINSIL